MRRLLALLGALCAMAMLQGVQGAGARELRDDAGRAVELPAQVERVLPAGPPAGLVLFSLVPDRLLGWTQKPSPAALALLGPAADLPAFGRLEGRGGEANFETILRLKPDLIVDIGQVSGTFVSLAERVQQATGIPYILLDGRLAALPATYRRLGAALGTSDAAEARAGWIEARLAEAQARVAAVPAEQRPRVYLARGASGLESARAGSINVEAVEAAGGRNVVGEALGGGGLVTLSMEQVLAFDPDVIVALDPAFFRRLAADPLWSKLRAVQAGRAVLAPQLPFPWVDYPPSVNRVMGIVWLSRLLYPGQDGPAARGVEAAARAFYRLFYHHELSADELSGLMKDAWFR